MFVEGVKSNENTCDEYTAGGYTACQKCKGGIRYQNIDFERLKKKSVISFVSCSNLLSPEN